MLPMQRIMLLIALCVVVGCGRSPTSSVPVASPSEPPPTEASVTARIRAVQMIEKHGGKIERGPDGGSLKLISLSRTPVSDADLQVLTTVPSEIKILLLDGTTISDSGVLHLAGLSGLQGLSLSETSVTDRSLKVIGKLTNLVGLYLTGTKVTDAGLLELVALNELDELELTGCTNLTPQGIAALQKKLPNCRIIK